MTAIQEYSQTEAGLQELRSRMAGVVYDVATTKGMDAARKDRRECVTLRTSLEAMRKEIKAPALERCKLIDSEAKRITEEILKLERPIDEAIKAEEARKEAEKAEKARIEQERVGGIKAKIQTIKEYPIKAINLSAAKLAEVLPNVEAIQIDAEEYQEFQGEAQFALMESVSKLKQIFADKQAAAAEAARIKAEQEAEAARLKAAQEEADRKAAEEQKKIEAERAELERLRKEDAARREEEDRKLREAREAEEAKLKAEREAEEKRLREIREAEEKRIAEERTKLEAEAAAKQAEIDRQQRELEEARAKAAAEEKARQEAEAARIAAEKAKAERMITCPKCGHTFDREEEAAEKEAA
jgi:colicin import membrane protein